MTIQIDAEFRDLIPRLTDDEERRLTESLLEEGCRETIILWGDIIVDGHNRYRICKQHNIPFRTAQKNFADRDDVKLWILRNQLARRNLSDIQRIDIVRKCEDTIKTKARERMLAGKADPEINFPQGRNPQSRDELGAMAGVSGKTYEHAVQALNEAPEPVRQALLNEEISINKAHEITKASPEVQAEIAYRLENIEQEPEETNTPDKIVKDALKPHVAYNSGNNEWYTPAEFIEPAREVLGTIDLDPASCDIANKIVQATEYYTKETNGLDKEWHGNVWLNPPYSSDLIGKFVDKFIEELPNLDSAIVLVNNATETMWFQKLAKESTNVCFPAGRVKFYTPDGRTGAPLQGQAVLYYGNNGKKFIDVFGAKGWCVYSA